MRYIKVTKPKIILGNLLSVVGGFLLAVHSRGDERIDYILFFFTLVSVLLVIASSCVFNNIIDCDIDKKMIRTQNRVLVKGLISKRISLIYATVLGAFGFTLLYFSVNLLTMWLGIMAFIIYVGVYSLYMKRHSIYATLIGSLSGAAPPVMGYCAVSDTFDSGARILFLIFSLWQMPHSYAIAIFRYRDYQIASIPVLPVQSGIPVTKYHITLYIIGFMIATFLLPLKGYTSSYNYLIIMGIICTCWLMISLQGYKSTNNDLIWARNLIRFSIITLVSLNIMLSVETIV